MLSRAWPSPTRRDGEIHCLRPSGPRWCKVAVAAPSVASEIGVSRENIDTIPHITHLEISSRQPIATDAPALAGGRTAGVRGASPWRRLHARDMLRRDPRA